MVAGDRQTHGGSGQAGDEGGGGAGASIRHGNVDRAGEDADGKTGGRGQPGGGRVCGVPAGRGWERCESGRKMGETNW